MEWCPDSDDMIHRWTCLKDVTEVNRILIENTKIHFIIEDFTLDDRSRGTAGKKDKKMKVISELGCGLL